MSVGAQTKASGSPHAGKADGGGLSADHGKAAGMLFRRLSVLPALLAIGWLLAGLPLLLLGWFRPAAMLVVGIPITAAVVYFAFRRLPTRWPETPLIGRASPVGTPWWSVIGVIAVAVAFGVDQMIYHSQFIIVTRDPASYMQFGAWIAHHGSLPIPQNHAAFGGHKGPLSFGSPAFYDVGRKIVPQFMAGLPMVLAGGFWIGGVSAAVAFGPILGALAVLTFGGLVARLAGPRWAPLAALVLALSLPMEFTSRSTYSEPLAMILFLGGLCLVIDCLGAEGTGGRILAAFGGLALGLTFLVRLDGASDILPVIPYCGMLVVGRRTQAWPLTGGFLLGVGYGVADGMLLTLPYIRQNRTSVLPLTMIAVVVLFITVIATLVLRLRRPPEFRRTLLSNVLAALPVLAVIALVIRPYVQVARKVGTSAFETSVAAYQLAAGQPIDPGRLYYEISLRWVFWYIGIPAVILGTIGAAILVRRCFRGAIPTWTLPLLVFSWAVVTTLYRPAITPDQPWASRRLVPAVLPAFILLAVWAVSWLIGWLREHDVARVLRGAALACCVVALVLPPTITTFGLGVQRGGPAGIKLTADGLALKRTYAGEIAAVNSLCAAMPPKGSVIFLVVGSSRAGVQLAEAVRGMCGLPAAILPGPRMKALPLLIQGIHHSGRTPVLLAGYPQVLQAYGGTPRHVINLHTQQDGSALTSPPRSTIPFNLSVWMSEPPR